ncbi:MAG: glycosyltransferase family 2 protein [Ruminococcus sp.]|nr:glycosyltransferase family 2 protein [Ruminococcus sp.]
MNELVTAVITTYNRETQILQRAVESVLAQTWRPLELIVVNDSPENVELADSIEKMLAKIQKEHQDVPVMYAPLEHNSGACAARNKGLELAKGEFISFLDDDDVWMEKKIELQRQGFISNETGMVYSPFIDISYKNPSKKQVIVRGNKSGKLLEDLLVRNVIGGTSMPMMRTDALRSIGGFDEELQSSQDYDVWLRIAQQYEIQFVEEPLTVRYLLEESITTNLKRKEQGWLRFTEKNLKYYKERRKAFEVRMHLFLKDIISLGDYSFAKEIMKKYKGLYGIRTNINYFVERGKACVKKLIGR